MKKNLVLIGMMGSGKSTIGKILSNKTKLNLIDIDKLIEKKTNLKISDIFKKKGENFFRKIEEKITINSLKSSDNIIATGGGAFLNDKIRKEIENNGISIWLRWGEGILMSRIKNNKKRPMAYFLKKKELNKLMGDRAKIYSRADYKINCDNLSKGEITSKILKIYENE